MLPNDTKEMKFEAVKPVEHFVKRDFAVMENEKYPKEVTVNKDRHEFKISVGEFKTPSKAKSDIGKRVRGKRSHG